MIFAELLALKGGNLLVVVTAEKSAMPDAESAWFMEALNNRSVNFIVG